MSTAYAPARPTIVATMHPLDRPGATGVPSRVADPGPVATESHSPWVAGRPHVELRRLVPGGYLGFRDIADPHYVVLPATVSVPLIVKLDQFDQHITGLEVIGQLHPFGEPVGADVVSRFYDSQGNTLDYVYDLTGDTLTIWAGAKGSPAYFEGTFSADDRSVAGEWTYPDGGGYDSTMVRQ